MQRGGRPIGHNPPPDPSVAAGLVEFNRHTDKGFLALGPTTTQPRFLAADVGLVDLDGAGQPVPAGPHQDRTQAVQHRPGGRVGADLQGPLQAQRRDAVLLGGEHPAGGEPHRQRRASSVEQGARGHRGPCSTTRALVPSVTDRPAAAMPTAWTNEAVWPAQPLQVVEAVSVSGEPGLELTGRPRIAPARPRSPLAHSPKRSPVS